MRLRPQPRARRHVPSALVLAFCTALALSASACAGGSAPPPPTASPRTALIPDGADPQELGASLTLDELCRRRFAEAPSADGLLVGLMTDSGGINDGTFNQYAYEGMIAASRCFGFETTYVATASTDDWATHLDRLIADGVDAVVTVGFLLSDVTAATAREHPQVTFVGVDQTADAALANYGGIVFRDDQAGFLAGAAAGLMTRSGTVGVVAGPDTVPPVVALAQGFAAGARETAGDVEVLVEHLPSFVDPELGGAAARELVRQGADVVYGPAGLTGAGAISAAADAGAWVIGVDQDQYYTTFEGGRRAAADRIVTSSVKRVDLGVFLALADFVTGTFEGGPRVLEVADDGVAYAPAHDAPVPHGVVAELARIRDRLASGALQVELAQTDG